MGYSIAVRCRSEKLRQRMFDFLERNYRDPVEVFKWGPKAYASSALRLGENLSYDDGKCSIGFDYSCMPEEEHQYVYCVLYWAALKVGKRRRFKKIGASVPYIVYDGYEAWPRLVRDEWEGKVPEDMEWCLVDALGFKSCIVPGRDEKFLQAMKTLMGHSCKKQDRMVRDELKRLDELWEGA